MILVDWQIKKLCEGKEAGQGLIEPFNPELINPSSIDILVGDTLMVEDPNEKRGHSLFETIDMKKEQFSIENPFWVEPGEFILVASHETFNLPPTICGEFRLKSSRAREGWDHCFVGSTLIPVPDERDAFKRIDELVVGDSVYSMEDGQARVGKVTASFVSGYVSKTVKVTLDNGHFFECTPEHRIMLRDGTYQEAKDLVCGRALMPFARRMYYAKGDYEREQVLSPNIYAQSNWESPKARWDFTHRVALIRGESVIAKGLVVHHKDGNGNNNRIDNLEVMTKKEHDAIHCKERAQSPEGRERSRQNAKKNLATWARSEEGRRTVGERGKRQAKEWNESLWSNPEHREKMLPIQLDNLRRGQAKPGYQEKTKRGAYIGRLKQVVRQMLEQGLEVSASNYTAVKPQRYPRVDSYEREFGSFEEALRLAGYENHKVIAVETVNHPILIPVYDITVDYFHNFALQCGIYAHNCLACWLDNGWHSSKLTMELKNNLRYSNLPIYPGLKIGQVIFYKTDLPDKPYNIVGRYNNDQSVMGSKG